MALSLLTFKGLRFPVRVANLNLRGSLIASSYEGYPFAKRQGGGLKPNYSFDALHVVPSPHPTITMSSDKDP
jgi:hypothetical protein